MRASAALINLAALVAACSSPDGGAVADVPRTMDELASTLDCDAMRGTQYDTGIFLAPFGQADGSAEVEKGRDCYRDRRFVARIHVFVEGVRPEGVFRRITSEQSIPGAPGCTIEPVQVVAGPNWAVVARDAGVAGDIAATAGGRTFVFPESHTVASYLLPCDGAAEPP